MHFDPKLFHKKVNRKVEEMPRQKKKKKKSYANVGCMLDTKLNKLVKGIEHSFNALCT